MGFIEFFIIIWFLNVFHVHFENCIFQHIITFLQISHFNFVSPRVLSASHSYSFNVMNCVDFLNIYYSEFLISSYSNAIIFQLSIIKIWISFHFFSWTVFNVSFHIECFSEILVTFITFEFKVFFMNNLYVYNHIL